ncbi:MAG: MFS transporter, partial [Actinomycetota bacterium]|nr:MFS transporter [Actinomycetota bacterium]
MSEGQLAIAFIGLNAGAIVGLQLGGIIVPHSGSRRALFIAIPVFAGALLAPGVASSAGVLVAALFLFSVANSVVDVAMNAQGVAVERAYGRPALSGMHAMHSLGGIVGAVAGAAAARLSVDPLI